MQRLIQSITVFLLPLLALTYLTTSCKSGGSSGGGDATGKTILCVGDSITRGFGASTSYPSILAGLTGAENVINAGVNGADSIDGRAAINGQLRRYNPDIVCIMYGANDILKGRLPETIVGNLTIIADAVKAYGAKPIVGQVTPMTAILENFSGQVPEVNRRLGSVGAPVAGTFKAVGSNLQADGLHPTDLGLSGIAGAFADKI